MRRTGFYILLLLLLSTCREIIDLEADRQLGQLVVYGHIDNGEDDFYVQISRTSSLPYQYIPEIGARVTLLDDQGNEGFYERTNEDGLWIYDRNSMRIIPGRSYRLRVRTANGQVYESREEQIPLARAIPDISVEFKQVTINAGSAGSIVTRNVMDIYAETFLLSPSADYYLRWLSIQTFRLNPTDFPDPFSSVPPPCFVNREIQPQKIPLFTSAGFSGDIIPKQQLGRIEIDYAFNNKNIITVKTFSQTRDAYEFYRKVGITLNNTGSLFDIPPASIPGNVYNVENPAEEILGYFDAASIELRRVTVTRDDFPYRVPSTECEYISGKAADQYNNYCIDCGVLEGSTRRRPDFY